MSKTAYEKIKDTAALPTPTGVAVEILRLTSSETATVRDITAAVEADPAIAGRLLKVVNSPLAGASRTIASVSRAVTLLGLRTVNSLALGFSLLSEHRDGACKEFHHESFWSESLARAVAARNLAHRLKSFAPDEAFTAGLLGKVGQLALATAFPEAYAYALGLDESVRPDRLRKIEREMFEIDHNELSAEMMADWHMPELFCQAVQRQDFKADGISEADGRTGELARMLHLASSTANVLTCTKIYRESLSLLVNEANRLGITPDVFHSVFDSIGEEWRGAGAILDVKTRSAPPLAEMYTQAHVRRDTLQEVEAGPAAFEVAVNVRA